MQCVTIFSTGRIFRLVLNVMQLHALTQVAHPYAVVDLSSTFPVRYSAYNEDCPFVPYEVSRAEPHQPQNNVYCQDGQE